jgi:hypothetical protein
MDAEMLVGRILEDEGLVEGLDEEAATVLVEWMVQQAEEIAARNDKQERAMAEVETLCKDVRDKVRRVTPDRDQTAQVKQLFSIS